MSYVDVFGTYTVPPSEVEYTSIVIFTQATLAWPDNFSGEVPDQHRASAIIEVTSSPGASLVLPPANETSVGRSTLIRNVGSEVLRLLNASEGEVTDLAPGVAKYLYVVNNTTPGGVWSTFTYGTGTSGADAAQLAGPGLVVDDNRLRVQVPYRGFDADYTVTLEDVGQLFDTVVGNLTLTLPPAAEAGAGFHIFFRNSSSANVKIQPSGGDKLDFGFELITSPGTSATIVSSGLGWATLGLGKDSTFIFSETIIDASTGDITLSSSQVVGRMIRVTGVATGGVTVTLPSVDNIYFVSTDAGLGVYGAQFQTADGGSTVALTANQKTALYCDGLNVSTAITTTVNSTLSLADGGPAAPTFFYALDTSTGFYRSANGKISFTSSGVEKVRMGPNGVELGVSAPNVAFTPSGGISANNVQAALQELDSEKQPKDATLTGIASVTTASNQLIYSTGVGAFSTTPCTAFSRTLLDDIDASAARATLGLGQASTQNIVAVTHGGTGRASVTSGRLLIGNGTGALNELGGTSIGQVPQWNGTSWSVGSLPASGVNNVTASAPLSSSGGASPNISFTGVLPVTSGGTGATSTATALFNLGAAAQVHQHSGSDITSGTIDVNRLGYSWLNGTPGYVRLPNGLILQWNGIYISGSSATITFPITFVSAAYSMHATAQNTNGSVGATFDNYSRFGLTIYVSQPTFVTWLVIGR